MDKNIINNLKDYQKFEDFLKTNRREQHIRILCLPNLCNNLADIALNNLNIIYLFKSRYNREELCELIIEARRQRDFYKDSNSKLKSENNELKQAIESIKSKVDRF